jgi:hypothetical protein
MPDFMTPAQLSKWRAETTAMTAAKHKIEAATVNEAPNKSDPTTWFYKTKRFWKSTLPEYYLADAYQTFVNHCCAFESGTPRRPVRQSVHGTGQ